MHIAIIGCGQLARMLAIAGIPLGIRFSFLAEPEEDSRCVDGLGNVARRIEGPYHDNLFEQLDSPDVITTEREQIDLALLKKFEGKCEIRPNVAAFSACQHRHREKQLLDTLGIPNAAYVYGGGAAAAVSALGSSMVVKSCTDGYDGKNQWILRSSEDIKAFDAARADGRDAPFNGGGDYIIEKMIPFEREVSQLSVRAVDGATFHYPLAENRHINGILSESLVPADADDSIAALAQSYISRIMQSLDYVGVMAVECFVVGDELLVNELAPRVHNSGHWTQAGSTTSQFENHIRAIAGMSLGSTDCQKFSGMFNLIGTERPPHDLLSELISIHWYDKVPRPGRKVGHINVRSDSREGLEETFRRLQAANVRVLTDK